MNNLSFPPARLAWTVWGLGAALYLFAFFQRVAPGVMTAELSMDFGLSASALGNLSAFYFYSYVAMQIPTGILADNLGPRRLLTWGALIAGLGTLFFAFSGSLALAAIGRLLIGGSVAVAFVCMLKLANHWFVPRQFALASGIALFTGIVGAVFAGVPLHLLVDAFGWRTVMAYSAIFPVVLAFFIWFMVRDDPAEKGFQSHVKHEDHIDKNPWARAVSGLVAVFRYRNTLLLSIVPGGMVGSILTFAGLWGVPFLTTHHGLSKSDAAAVCSAMLIAWAIGGPILGALSDRIGRRKPLYVLGCGINTLCWGLVVLMPTLPIIGLITLLLIAGFSSGSMIIGFAYAKESVPTKLAGTVSGVVNMGVMMGPMILQPAVGWMLDRGWQNEQLEGVRIYNISAYQSGFLLMLGWVLLAFILILLTKETGAKQTEA